MGTVIVCGSGVVGLAAATMLARDGHAVTVLDADSHAVPEPGRAWAGWPRPGVPHFRQPHILQARFRRVCDEELPEITPALRAAGGTEVDYVAAAPPGLTDRAPRPDDAGRRILTARRPVVEAVVAAVALGEPTLRLRRGTRVAGLLGGPAATPGIPHVTGVRTADGKELRADLVIDATGRRSRSSGWLTALGARPPAEEHAEHGFAYYTRYFTGPVRPSLRGRPLTPLGSISLLTLHGDNDTWSVTVYGRSGDAPLRELRDAAVFDRVVAACPGQAHWLDGHPLGPVLPMAGVTDRRRRFVVDGRPVATGFAAVGDAWACTNPSAGRGLSVGLLHAQVLRRCVRADGTDPVAFALSFDHDTEQTVGPFHTHQQAADRRRVAGMEAAAGGRPAPPPGASERALLAAAARDADAFRGVLDVALCLAQPAEVMARPAVAAAVARHGDEPVAAAPGPGRPELLDLLTGSAPALSVSARSTLDRAAAIMDSDFAPLASTSHPLDGVRGRGQGCEVARAGCEEGAAPAVVPAALTRDHHG